MTQEFEVAQVVALSMKSVMAPFLVRIATLEALVKTLDAQLKVPGTVGPVGPVGPTGEKGMPGAHGERGEKGADGGPGLTGPEGQRGERGPEGQPGPQGVPGRDGRDGEGKIGPSGEKGADGTPGMPGPRGDVGLAGKDGSDGLGIDDLQVTYDGARTFIFRWSKGTRVVEKSFAVPAVLYRGIFDATRTYEPGDQVTCAGSTWIAKAVTTQRPDEDGDGARAWTLCSKRGPEGKRGLQGKDGTPGKDGRPGRDLTNLGPDGSKWGA